jgi:hypothetical protein
MKKARKLQTSIDIDLTFITASFNYNPIFNPIIIERGWGIFP